VLVRSPGDVLVQSGAATSSPNYFVENVRVTTPTRPVLGCPVFLASGGMVYVHSGQTLSDGTRLYACNDHAVSPGVGTPVVQPFACNASGTDAGCRGSVACPAGRRLVAIRAACDLETGTLATTAVGATPWNAVRVERASDAASEGHCVASAVDIATGRAFTGAELGASAAAFGCREHDANGGDCAIRGEALCL
jgi:hypothetical protein